GWGWTLFGLVWGMAAVGIVLKVWFVGRYPIASTIVYVAMGWIAIVAVKPILAMVPVAGVLWLLAGGVLYTAGVGEIAVSPCDLASVRARRERVPLHRGGAGGGAGEIGVEVAASCR